MMDAAMYVTPPSHHVGAIETELSRPQSGNCSTDDETYMEEEDSMTQVTWETM